MFFALQILALVLGPFESPLAAPKAAELKLNDVVYLASKRAFNPSSDTFPPMARSGGLKSEFARLMVDLYLWDKKHLKLVKKLFQFDDRHQVTRRMSAAAKTLDEKFGISCRASAVASNERVC